MKNKKRDSVPYPKKITFVNVDDWVGVYLDGKLEYENHSIDADDCLTLLGIECESLWVDPDWMGDRCRLPEDLKDVKFEKE